MAASALRADSTLSPTLLLQTPCVILVTSHFREGKEGKLEGALKLRAYIFLFLLTFTLNK